MPVTKSAKKKLRKDTKREKANQKLHLSLKKALKKSKSNLSAKNLADVTKIIDKAAKKNIIHRNKAARIKSKLSKLGTTKSSKAIKNKAAKTSKK